jgi:hypothetical protein
VSVSTTVVDLPAASINLKKKKKKPYPYNRNSKFVAAFDEKKNSERKKIQWIYADVE